MCSCVSVTVNGKSDNDSSAGLFLFHVFCISVVQADFALVRIVNRAVLMFWHFTCDSCDISVLWFDLVGAVRMFGPDIFNNPVMHKQARW